MKPINMRKDYIESRYKDEVILKIRELLEAKHLYQSVSLDLSKLENEISNVKDIRPRPIGLSFNQPKIPQETLDNAKQEALRKMLSIISKVSWEFATESKGFNDIQKGQEIPIRFFLPTINIVCKKCKGNLLPHNSGYKGLNANLPELTFYQPSSNRGAIQLFFFPFQCQRCKDEPIIFMVKRNGNKIQMVGRSHFEHINIPKFLPNNESEFYRDARVAYNSGKILAGLFYLRTMLEQYMRRVTKVTEKKSGEDLADMYADLLDDEFPKKFTSLKTVYGELSEKLHGAIEDAEQFEKSEQEIIKHFDLLQHFKLKELSNKSDCNKSLQK